MHAEIPIRAFVAPGRLDGIDAWDTWSREQLHASPIAGLEAYAERPSATKTPRKVLNAIARYESGRQVLPTHFSLEGFRLGFVPSEVFSLKRLAVLDLQDNKLRELPEHVVIDLAAHESAAGINYAWACA